MEKRTEIPYSQTLTRTQFFAQELERLGIAQHSDLIKTLFVQQWPNQDGDNWWNGTFAWEGEVVTEKSEECFDYVVHTMRVQIERIVEAPNAVAYLRAVAPRLAVTCIENYLRSRSASQL